MQKHLVEIKARTTRTEEIRQLLQAKNANFRGTDHQIDHYFNVSEGRLKLRHGTIEQSLIFYRRPDQAGPKDSAVALSILPDEATAISLAATLDAALGTWATVDKQREIYSIDNVKFHLDTVVGLGTFVEIEAVGNAPENHARLLEQCQTYVAYLGIAETDLIDASYSDLLSR